MEQLGKLVETEPLAALEVIKVAVASRSGLWRQSARSHQLASVVQATTGAGTARALPDDTITDLKALFADSLLQVKREQQDRVDLSINMHVSCELLRSSTWAHTPLDVAGHLSRRCATSGSDAGREAATAVRDVSGTCTCTSLYDALPIALAQIWTRDSLFFVNRTCRSAVVNYRMKTSALCEISRVCSDAQRY